MYPNFPTLDRAGAGTPAPKPCPNCGRKRLARTETCLFCGKRLPSLTDMDHSVIASPGMLGRQNGLTDLSSTIRIDDDAVGEVHHLTHPLLDQILDIRIDDDAIGEVEHLTHPLFDPLLDGEFLDHDLQQCDYCGKATCSLKSFELPAVLCLFPLYIPSISIEAEPIVACPGCMRWYIAKFLLCNVVTANILWPFFSLLPSLYLFAMTIPKGHSTGEFWRRS
jgi:hypothetical protein